jgi:hypothetical protein
LEWVPLALFAVAGLPLDRRVPARRARQWFYAALLLTAFIFDLNKVTFRSDIADAVFWSLILIALSELFWAVVRKESRLLLGGALVLFVPVFVYVYFALLMLLPLPCHDNMKAVIGSGECGAAQYTVKKRLSFDIFKPAQILVLVRDVKSVPFLEKQVDKYQAPKGYMEAAFTPQWRCEEDGAFADLVVDGGIVWSLKEEFNKE